MKRFLTWTLLVTLLALCACASTDAYAAATQTYHAEAATYTEARAVIVDGGGNRRPGVLNDAQWSRFRADEAQVISADAAVYADLAAWEQTGKKPPAFDTHAATLRAAQNRIIALAQEVR